MNIRDLIGSASSSLSHSQATLREELPIRLPKHENTQVRVKSYIEHTSIRFVAF